MTARGYSTERELVNTLEDDFGFAAFRSGTSGSGTDRERPDVIALHAGTSWAVEVKKAKAGTVTLKSHEVPDLCDFADRAGAVPVVAVRPSFNQFDHWLVYDARELNETPNGHSVRKSDHDRGQSLAEFFGGESA